MAESSPDGLKTLWEKEKLLVKRNSSLFRSINERLALQTRKNKGLTEKGLIIKPACTKMKIMLHGRRLFENRPVPISAILQSKLFHNPLNL